MEGLSGQSSVTMEQEGLADEASMGLRDSLDGSPRISELADAAATAPKSPRGVPMVDPLDVLARLPRFCIITGRNACGKTRFLASASQQNRDAIYVRDDFRMNNSVSDSGTQPGYDFRDSSKMELLARSISRNWIR